MPAKKNELQFGSLCVQQAKINKAIQPHTEAIYATSAFLFDSAESAMALFNDREKGFIYSRWGNPTVEMLEIKIAALEVHGTGLQAKAQLFSSGMAAISSLIISCVKKGQKLITQHQLYGTTDEFIQSLETEWDIQNVRCDLNNMSALESILKADKKIKLIYIETPSNPMMEVYDIELLARLAKKYSIKLAVDNTFSSPYLQQPLKWGADFSIHSTTKFLNGHGTGLGGVVVGKDISFMKNEVWKKVKLLGSNSNAFDAWFILQGIKTLELRMMRHCENASVVADYLRKHKAVTKVNFCGFKDHPQHKIAKKQMRYFGSMLSFELKGGLKAGIKLMNTVKLCHLVTSLGTVDTLIQHPASMTHVNVSKQRRLEAGITDGLVRMSVGIEHVNDIIADLENGLKYYKP
jgi:methionine-gamma-lyase